MTKLAIENDDFEAVDGGEDEVEMYGEKEARWYQIAARNQVADGLERGIKRILVEQPTGSGKTLTSGLIFSDDRVRKACGVKPGKKLRLLFVAHKHRLLTQAEQSYADASNVQFIPHSAFQDIPPGVVWDIACIDEAHHEAMQTIQYRLDRLGRKPIIGLTATPDRADGMLIKFELIVAPISREQCVLEGWLAETSLNSIIDTPASDKFPVTKMIIDQFGKEFGRTMMFFRTKNEVRKVNEYLSSLKYKSIAILDQSNNELDDLLNRFSDGKVQFLLNCNKINEGVDVKGCTDVFLGRSYGSYPQLNQVIGRASRPDSECNVWELINPLSGRNLDTTVVVGTPKRHRLISKRHGEWIEQDFDYVSHRNEIQSGITIRHGANGGVRRVQPGRR